MCGPAVIQWVGKNRNYEDFLVGVAFQKRTPFTFQFDKVVIKNGVDLKVISKIFQLIECKEVRIKYYTLPYFTVLMLMNLKLGNTLN